MSKTSEHSLFLLIHSMDATEKAYFKKFAFKRSNKNNESFKALFDAVDKQKTKDINLLRMSKSLSASHKNNIHAALNSLFKLVCQVLIEYRKEKGNNQKLFTMLAEFDLFKEKGLLELAEKKYHQIEQFAQDNRLYHFTPYVYQLRGSQLTNNSVISKEKLEEYFAKLDLSKRNLDINIDINKLSLKLEQVFHQNGGVVKKSTANDQEADELLAFTDEILRKSKDNFLFTSVVTNNRFIIQMIYGRLENLPEHMRKYFEYFDNNIDDNTRDNELGDILITLKNFAVVSVYLNYQDLYLSARKRLEIVGEKYSNEQAQIKLLYRLKHLAILNYALNDISNEAITHIDEFLNNMETVFKNKAQYSEAVLSSMMALVRNGQLDKALLISDEFVSNQHNERIRDQYISVRMLRAIIWFKKDVFEVYESEIKSIHRKVSQFEKFPFQLQIIKTLKQLKPHTEKAKNEAIIEDIIRACNDILEKETGSKMMKAIELKNIALFALR